LLKSNGKAGQATIHSADLAGRQFDKRFAGGFQQGTGLGIPLRYDQVVIDPKRIAGMGFQGIH
jgi:hypothetical protein